MVKPRGVNWKDGMSALVLLSLSLLICIASLSTLSLGHYYHPGPGFLPFWSGVLLGAMSLGLLVKSILQGNGSLGKFLWRGLYKPICALLALIIYGLLFETVGYFICNFLLMVFMIKILERKKWPLAVGAAFLTALSFYLVFSIWLKLLLPRGILGLS